MPGNHGDVCGNFRKYGKLWNDEIIEYEKGNL